MSKTTVFNRERARELMVESGRPLRWYSRKAGLSRDYIHQLLNGNRNPRGATIRLLAELLEVPLSELTLPEQAS